MDKNKPDALRDDEPDEIKRNQLPLLLLAIVGGLAIFVGVAVCYVKWVDKPPPALPDSPPAQDSNR